VGQVPVVQFPAERRLRVWLANRVTRENGGMVLEVCIDIQHRSAQLDGMLPGVGDTILHLRFSSCSTKAFVATFGWDGWMGGMIEMS